MNKISYKDIDITGGFWQEKQKLVKETTVHSVYKRFKETGRFDALKCLWKEGMENKPHIFWDSDVAKWIEGAAYILAKEDNKEIRDIAEEAIDDIISNADKDGYFNSYFLVAEQDKRFTYRPHHELYCAGHLIEAAVAYRDATGDDRLLKAMCKFADYIEKEFVLSDNAAFVTPGHPELELALVRLYDATGEKRYLKLAQFFIDKRGDNNKDKQIDENHNPINTQDEVPVRDRTTADGHSVRALYLMCGAADVGARTNDKELIDACRRVFDNIEQKRMYITGGVGSTSKGEAFTIDYDLPGRTAYAETCAAISLAMFASRMQAIEPDSKYADVAERAIYNGVLSGMSMDGKAFFYENPLEIDPEFNDVNRSTEEKERYPITQRKEVFDCSCCPPNMVRFVPSVAGMMYTYDDDTLYVHHYMNSDAKCGGISISQSTNYPADGEITIKYTAAQKKIALRIPGWCSSFDLDREYTMSKGYAYMDAEGSGEIHLKLDMLPVLVRANNKVHACAGRVAVMRGPVVYCAESVDNDCDIFAVSVGGDELTLSDGSFILPEIHTIGHMHPEQEKLYVKADSEDIKVPLTLIPYYAFANRGESGMLVWMLSRN